MAPATNQNTKAYDFYKPKVEQVTGQGGKSWIGLYVKKLFEVKKLKFSGFESKKKLWSQH